MKGQLTFVYERIGVRKNRDLFLNHFNYIKNLYPIILPGDHIDQKISVCLTFDDASFHFYHTIFPLLKSLNIKAILAIPVRYILDQTNQASADRLKVPYPLMMQDGIFETKAPFCTWEEINEMVQSGYVEVASHSFSHSNLTFPFVNWEKEVLFSKKILEERLPQAITSFMYPFGKSNNKIDIFIKKYYLYSFQKKPAFNINWNSKYPLNRVSLTTLASENNPLRLKEKIHLFINNFFIFP